MSFLTRRIFLRLQVPDSLLAFLVGAIGPAIGLKIRGVLEFSGRDEGDDEWAEFHGLV